MFSRHNDYLLFRFSVIEAVPETFFETCWILDQLLGDLSMLTKACRWMLTHVRVGVCGELSPGGLNSYAPAHDCNYFISLPLTYLCT